MIRIVHSHVYEAPTPSMADRVGCEASGIPWLIVNHPTGEWLEFVPSGYVAPLLDRPYCWGVFDCGTLARDYYVSQGIPIDADPQCWAVVCCRIGSSEKMRLCRPCRHPSCCRPRLSTRQECRRCDQVHHRHFLRWPCVRPLACPLGHESGSRSLCQQSLEQQPLRWRMRQQYRP